MADRFLTNYAPAQTHAWWAIWKLGTELMAAGYQLLGNGDGTSSKVGVITPGSADDLWSALSPAGGAAAPSAWCCLRNPTLGFEIVLWRDTTTDWTGKIIIAKSTDQFALSAGRTATDPGTIPASAGYLRGSGAAWAFWMGGGTQAVGVLQIGVKDVAGADGGSFYILGSSPLYPIAGMDSWAHSLKCAILDPYCATQGVDPEPYAFQCVYTPTNNYGAFDLSTEWWSDGVTGATGPWWGYRADGTWSQFGSGTISVYQTGASLVSAAPTDPYSAGTKYFLDRILIIIQETAHQERKGWTRSFRYSKTSHAQYSTFSALTFAKFACGFQSDQWIVFWDGATASPHG